MRSPCSVEDGSAGDYKVVVKAGTKELIAPRVSLAAGQSVTLTMAMKNGQLGLR